MAPWRLTFLIVGIPGCAGRGAPCHGARADAPQSSWSWRTQTRSGEGVRRVLRRAAHALEVRDGRVSHHGLPGDEQLRLRQLGARFFERIHHWPKSRAGLVLGSLTLGCGCVGLLVGGRLSDRWLRRGVHEGPLRVGLLSWSVSRSLWCPRCLRRRRLRRLRCSFPPSSFSHCRSAARTLRSR